MTVQAPKLIRACPPKPTADFVDQSSDIGSQTEVAYYNTRNRVDIIEAVFSLSI